MSTDSYDTSWYFTNPAFYHILYDFTDFEDPIYLQSCNLPQDNITFIDKSVIFFDGIRKIWFDFKINSQTNWIFLLSV